MFHDLLTGLELNGLKPLLAALVLPPVPLLLVLLGAAALLWRRRAAGWLLLVPALAGLWFTTTELVGDALMRQLQATQRALSAPALRALRRAGGEAPRTAIVVLGGGREAHAPEYGMSNLSPAALERLRYGAWLARETGWPLAFSGGVGHGQQSGPAEADIAARIAARELARPVQWVESESRDTRENAARIVPLLRADGVTRIVLVTHGWHMRRSMRALEQAIDTSGGAIALLPAPMGLSRHDSPAALRWLPSTQGFVRTRTALREYLAWWVGA